MNLGQKLTWAQADERAREVRALLRSGLKQREVAARLNMSRGNVAYYARRPLLDLCEPVRFKG